MLVMHVLDACFGILVPTLSDGEDGPFWDYRNCW